ncbi:MAG: hypothetical protein ABIR54_22375 [Burkholderiaceae bacterium]
MNNPHRLSLLLCAVMACASCGASEDTVFTLYRNSALDPQMRIHVATFDAADGEKYNSENCTQAAELFRGQPGVKTRFWCEKGHFKK